MNETNICERCGGPGRIYAGFYDGDGRICLKCNGVGLIEEKPIVVSKCAWCGEKFEVKNSGDECCSEKCSDEYFEANYS